MFCDQCQNVLNLDILLSTHENYPGNNGEHRPYPHYKTFAAIEQSAGYGCELCTLVCSAISDSQKQKMRELTGEDAQMRFEFWKSDYLFFVSSEKDPDYPQYQYGISLSVLESEFVYSLQLGLLNLVQMIH